MCRIVLTENVGKYCFDFCHCDHICFMIFFDCFSDLHFLKLILVIENAAWLADIEGGPRVLHYLAWLERKVFDERIMLFKFNLIMQIFVLTHMMSFTVHHILFVMIRGLSMLKDNHSEYHMYRICT